MADFYARYAGLFGGGGGGGGGGGVTTMGTFGSTPNDDGGTISGTVLTLQPADATHPGGLSNGAQSIGGIKTFPDDIQTDYINLTNGAPVALLANFILRDNDGNNSVAWELNRLTDNTNVLSLDWLARELYDSSAELSIGWEARQLFDENGILALTWDASGVVVANDISAANLSGTNTGDVTLAAVGAVPNANAATLTGQVLNLELFDDTFPGVVPASGGGTTNFLRADGTWAAPPDTTGVTTMGTFGSSPNADGATISSTTLTLQPADGTNPGGVSTTTQTFAGAKTFSATPTFSTMTEGSVLFAGTSGVLSQDNAKLFWDNTNDRLGINTTTPTVSIDMINTTAGGVRFVDDGVGGGTSLYRYTTNATPYFINVSKSRGTLASPTTIVSGDGVGTIQYFAHDGTALRSVGTIDTVATTVTGTDDITSRIAFSARPAGAAAALSEVLSLAVAGSTLTGNLTVTGNLVGFQQTTTTISATTIDWSTLYKSTGLYMKTLAANTTFTFSNATAGQTIVVKLTNTASNYTVTWPTVSWPAASTPVMTTGAKSDIYTFIYDGTTYYGSYVQDFA